MMGSDHQKLFLGTLLYTTMEFKICKQLLKILFNFEYSTHMIDMLNMFSKQKAPSL